MLALLYSPSVNMVKPTHLDVETGSLKATFGSHNQTPNGELNEGGMKNLLPDQSRPAPEPPRRKHCAVLEEGEHKGLSEVPLFEMQRQVRL